MEKKKFIIAQLQPTDKITILNILGTAQQNDMKKMVEEEKLQTLPNFQLLTSFLSNLQEYINALTRLQKTEAVLLHMDYKIIYFTATHLKAQRQVWSSRQSLGTQATLDTVPNALSLSLLIWKIRKLKPSHKRKD